MATARKPRPSGYPTEDLAALRVKALTVTTTLTALYGESAFSRKDALSMLVDILLSHRTKDAQTAAAYASLLRTFGDWATVRDAPTAEVEAAISGVTWPEQKAPRIQAILRQITAERGALNLDFLCTMPVAEAAAWLGRLSGVGPKTVACVLLFSCRLPILPVDTHVHRVGGRLGLITPKVNAEDAHPLLQALLPDDARTIYDFHKALLRHGQRICVYTRPQCGRCAVRDHCDYFAALKTADPTSQTSAPVPAPSADRAS
ncbi:MAG: endonuclease III [Ktedonobacterales bacterium]|nr:endonuclease III [Ktedonobacterales bacterium]